MEVMEVPTECEYTVVRIFENRVNCATVRGSALVLLEIR